LVALFYFLSIALYLKARLTNNNYVTKYLLFSGSLISAILAMLSKENAYTLPFAIVLFELFFLRTGKFSINFRDYRILLLIGAFISFVLLVLFKFSLSIFNPIAPDFTNDYRTITPLNYLLTQFSVIIKYIQLLFLPISQNFDYDFKLSNNFFEIKTLLSFIVLLSCGAAALFLFNKNRIVSFCIFWFLLTLSVESSIIPIDDLIVEHRTYLPSFSFFLIISSGIYFLLWNEHKYLAASILAIIIVSNSFLTYERNKVWRNELSLWSDVVTKSPDKARPFANRGCALFLENKIYAAIDDFNKAIELQPSYTKAYFNRGVVYINANRNTEALNDFNKVIEQRSDFGEAYLNRGLLFEKEKKHALAIADFNKAISLDTNFTLSYFNRGNAFLNTNRNDEAISDYNKVIKQKPDFAEAYHNLGMAFYSKESNEEAISNYSKAIELKKDYAEAFYNRGFPEYDSGKKDIACIDWKKAIELGYQPATQIYNKFCH